MKVQALLIPVDGPCSIVEVDGLESMQKLVGGYIECVCIVETRPNDDGSDSQREIANLWINEEGKLEDLPRNVIATWLVTEAYFVGLMDGDFISGPAFVTGPTDDEGNVTPIDAALIRKIAEKAKEYVR